MRIRVSKSFIFLVVIFNLLMLILTWKYFKIVDNENMSTEGKAFEKDEIKHQLTTLSTRNRILESKRALEKSLTVVFRDFYHFDNDLKSNIDNLLNFLPNLRILIISNDFPNPPLNIFSPVNFSSDLYLNYKPTLIYKDNVQFFTLKFDITKNPSESDPLNFIQTKYTLIMPDGIKLSNSRQMLHRLIKSISVEEHNSRYNKSTKTILVVPFQSNQKFINYCFQIKADLENWTLEYIVKNSTTNCDLVSNFYLVILLIGKFIFQFIYSTLKSMRSY
jgi:hypothetical protein